MKKFRKGVVLAICAILMSACTRQESAINNSKMEQTQSSEENNTSSTEVSKEVSAKSLDETVSETNSSQVSLDPSQIGVIETEKKSHSSLNYNCDIEKDKQNFDETKMDIVVGDDYYSTQINDWYTNFDEYEGKMVEIEGYYIADYLPYLFVGRYGPTCPYCQGGYVCFEFYTKEDLTELVSGQDWIKVKGILRKDKDEHGEFNYIETLSIEKMDTVGLDTVTN